MRKLICFLIVFLTITGCSSNKKEANTVSKSLQQQYVTARKKLENNKYFETQCSDFNTSLIVNKIDNDEIRYDIIFNNPQIEMMNIQALCYVCGEQNSNCPSIGLLEKQEFSMIPNIVDKDRGIYKGINLSGMTKLKSIDLKIYIKYKSNGNIKERYLRINGDATR